MDNQNNQSKMVDQPMQVQNTQPMSQLPIDIRIQEQKQRLEKLERFKELEIAARPLQEYLKKYHNPHCAIAVVWDRVLVSSEICSTSL